MENTCARDSFSIKLKESPAQVFSWEFCEISKITFFFTEHLRWLLLDSTKFITDAISSDSTLKFFCSSGNYEFGSPEAVVWRCSSKKVFLKMSPNSQENTCARVSFLGEIFKEHQFIIEHLQWPLLEVCPSFWSLTWSTVRFGSFYLTRNAYTYWK